MLLVYAKWVVCQVQCTYSGIFFFFFFWVKPYRMGRMSKILDFSKPVPNKSVKYILNVAGYAYKTATDFTILQLFADSILLVLFRIGGGAGNSQTYAHWVLLYATS